MKFVNLSLQGLNTAEIGLGGWNTWIDEDVSEQGEDISEQDAVGHDDGNNKLQLLVAGINTCVPVVYSF